MAHGRLVSLFVAAAVVLAGCTGDGDSVAGPHATATAPAAEETSPGGAVQEDADDVLGDDADIFGDDADILRVAITEPSTLDPMRIQDPGSLLIARQLFEGLTRWDPEAHEVIPAAAREWEVSRGGRRFVFTLRAGMTFHDGTPVTAADFKFAFDRIARRRSASDLAYTLERVRGFTATNQLRTARTLRGVRVRNDSTLVIDLAEPFHDFPAVLTHPGLVPLRRPLVRDLDEFLSAPVGNGPFMMAAPWEPGSEIVLEPHDDHRDPPALDGIRFVPYRDAAEAWGPFRNEELDVAEVPVGQIEVAAEDYGESGFTSLLAGYYLGFNLDARPFRNERVRRAVAFAIDRESIAEDVYKGSMLPPRGIVPRGMPGFEDGLCPVCTYDPDRAGRLVRGLPRRARRITLEYTRGRPHGEVARAVKSALEDAGFRVEIRGFGFSRYLRRLRTGRSGFFRLGWIAEFPSPDVFLSSLFASDAADNHTGFSSPRVDRLLARAHRTRDPQSRLRLYRRAERAVMRRVPVVPIGSFEIHWASQPWVQGMVFDVMGGFDARGVSLSDGP